MPPAKPQKKAPSKLSAKATPKYNQVAALARNQRTVAQAKASVAQNRANMLAGVRAKAVYPGGQSQAQLTQASNRPPIGAYGGTQPGMFGAAGKPPVTTTLPDTAQGQFARAAETATVNPPWWSDKISPQEWTSRHRVRNILGPLARPTFVRPQPEGYTEAVPPSYPAEDTGYTGYGGGGGGGFIEYPSYTPKSGGGYGVYAPVSGGGANPMRAQSPRWWHNRLTWRF